jgi:hypothetical protein
MKWNWFYCQVVKSSRSFRVFKFYMCPDIETWSIRIREGYACMMTWMIIILKRSPTSYKVVWHFHIQHESLCGHAKSDLIIDAKLYLDSFNVCLAKGPDDKRRIQWICIAGFFNFNSDMHPQTQQMTFVRFPTDD